ncbi:MAG: type II secretion system protein [Verrucomicrobiaceae bacterium]|nr:MAG: type II secretion system protein [Verrucomicrobiaceae bacterium]
MRTAPPTMKRHGFTLVEMIIVLAIVGVFSAMVYPLASSAIAKSREATCVTRLRALGTALQSYLQDNNDVMPELAMGRSSKTEDLPVLDTVLLPYAGSEDAFRCPADTKEFSRTGCSYHWNHLQSGRRSHELSFFDFKSEKIPLITDKEAWHPGGTNYLYADLSSSNKPRFATEKR